MKQEILVLGFTGTRRGMTSEQKIAFAGLLTDFFFKEFHHGDCLGADAQAHDIVMDETPNVRIYAHPPKDWTYRAWKQASVILPCRDYLARNKDIVAVSNLIVACPSSHIEARRGSGTWSTMREARRRNKQLAVIWPEGNAEWEWESEL